MRASVLTLASRNRARTNPTPAMRKTGRMSDAKMERSTCTRYSPLHDAAARAPNPDEGAAARTDHHPGRGDGLLVVHHEPDSRAARAATGSGGPRPEGLSPAPANPERPQLARPGD